MAHCNRPNLDHAAPPCVATTAVLDCRRRRAGRGSARNAAAPDGSIARSVLAARPHHAPRGTASGAAAVQPARGTHLARVGIAVDVAVGVCRRVQPLGPPWHRNGTGRAAELASKAARAEGASPPPAAHPAAATARGQVGGRRARLRHPVQPRMGSPLRRRCVGVPDIRAGRAASVPQRHRLGPASKRASRPGEVPSPGTPLQGMAGWRRPPGHAKGPRVPEACTIGRLSVSVVVSGVGHGASFARRRSIRGGAVAVAR